MAASILRRDVTEHLEAAIQLSNRRVHLRFLDEADALLELNFPAAAVLVAGVVLESILASQPDRQAPEDRQRMENWSELRNRVVHAHELAVSLNQAREMVGDVRRSLLGESRVGPRLASGARLTGVPRQVRGKYQFVPTSSAEFIRRKADELRLEHDERGN
jgi:hypothetical protein